MALQIGTWTGHFTFTYRGITYITSTNSQLQVQIQNCKMHSRMKYRIGKYQLQSEIQLSIWRTYKPIRNLFVNMKIDSTWAPNTNLYRISFLKSNPPADITPVNITPGLRLARDNVNLHLTIILNSASLSAFLFKNHPILLINIIMTPISLSICSASHFRNMLLNYSILAPNLCTWRGENGTLLEGTFP